MRRIMEIVVLLVAGATLALIGIGSWDPYNQEFLLPLQLAGLGVLAGYAMNQLGVDIDTKVYEVKREIQRRRLNRQIRKQQLEWQAEHAQQEFESADHYRQRIESEAVRTF